MSASLPITGNDFRKRADLWACGAGWLEKQADRHECRRDGCEHEEVARPRDLPKAIEQGLVVLGEEVNESGVHKITLISSRWNLPRPLAGDRVILGSAPVFCR
jgi:hypothetical protein